MPKAIITTVSAQVQRRLEEIRGDAPRRSKNVRALAAYADHSDCNLATLAFASDVDLDRLLLKTQFEGPFGQLQGDGGKAPRESAIGGIVIG